MNNDDDTHSKRLIDEMQPRRNEGGETDRRNHERAIKRKMSRQSYNL